MSIRIFWSAVVTALLVAIAVPPSATDASQTRWSSQWRTTLGIMNIENLPNGEVYGEWSNRTQSGEVRGFMQADGTFRGHWYLMRGTTGRICKTASLGTSEWGALSMRFNRSALTFDGSFSYCKQRDRSAMSGEMLWSHKRGRIRE